MTPDHLLALALFALAVTGTPGPNNAMLLASGANFGLRRTLPHMAGIWLGLASLIAVAGLGGAGLLLGAPAVLLALKIAAAGYLLWLAWKIAGAGAPQGRQAARPLSLLQAAAFQWVNPKAWALSLTTVTVYLPDPGPGALATAVAIFVAVSVPVNGSWTFAGQRIARHLTSPRSWRIFNTAMALLLVASLGLVLR